MKGVGPKLFCLSYMTGGPSRDGFHRSGAAKLGASRGNRWSATRGLQKLKESAATASNDFSREYMAIFQWDWPVFLWVLFLFQMQHNLKEKLLPRNTVCNWSNLPKTNVLICQFNLLPTTATTTLMRQTREILWCPLETIAFVSQMDGGVTAKVTNMASKANSILSNLVKSLLIIIESSLMWSVSSHRSLSLIIVHNQRPTEKTCDFRKL